MSLDELGRKFKKNSKKKILDLGMVKRHVIWTWDRTIDVCQGTAPTRFHRCYTHISAGNSMYAARSAQTVGQTLSPTSSKYS
jgi:hypothetical protein